MPNVNLQNREEMSWRCTSKHIQTIFGHC